MLLTYARAFAVISANIEFNRGQVNGAMILGESGLIDGSHVLGKATLTSLEALRELCEGIPSLNPVLDPIQRAKSKIENGILPIILHNELESLQHRIHDDLKRHYYYPVTEIHAAVYHNEAPWGDDVCTAFPSARMDIKNAGKCIVLGQATAGVFHLMRVMEVGLKVLGRAAEIPYAPSWESYLSQINKKIEASHKDKTNAWKRKELLMKDLCGDLIAIKFAWRNPTMHIVREYSIQEAENVYGAVKTFIERLATKHKERGKPVAVRVVLQQ